VRPPHSVNSAKSTDSHFPLAISPHPLPLGSLDPGQAAVGYIEVNNPGPEQITVDQVETSCPCLEVFRVPSRIDPGQSRKLTLRFNPTEEPNFRGRLTIEVTGRTAEGRVVFRTRARVEVGTGTAGPPNRPHE